VVFEKRSEIIFARAETEIADKHFQRRSSPCLQSPCQSAGAESIR
jgi:hypothetical protein